VLRAEKITINNVEQYVSIDSTFEKLNLTYMKQELTGAAAFVTFLMLIHWIGIKLEGISVPWYHYVLLYIIYFGLFALTIVWANARKQARARKAEGK